MPWALKRVGKGYKVITIATGKAHSKKPQSKKKALAQLRVLESIASEGGAGAKGPSV